MYTTTTIFLSIIVFFVGAAIGSLVERATKRHSAQRPLLPSVKNRLTDEGDVEVFGAWRTGSNKIWLEMDGIRLDTKEALLPEQHQRLLNLVLDLRPWLETTRLTKPGTGAVPQPIRFAAPGSGDTAQPFAPIINKKASTGEASLPAPARESIIEQIDKVLQAKLANSMFKDRGIRLIEGPGGIVIIKDGVNRYEGVDTISDPQVKILIQQAVADWEKGTK